MTDTVSAAPSLLPCPFCGGDPSHDKTMDESLWSHETVPYRRVHCRECEIGTYFVCDGSETSEVEQWNRRVPAVTPSDAEIEALAAEHLKSFAQSSGAGDVWVEGEVAFARAVLARWGAPHPVAREPLTDEQITEIWEAKVRYHAAPIGSTDLEFARDIERAHGIGAEKGDGE